MLTGVSKVTNFDLSPHPPHPSLFQEQETEKIKNYENKKNNELKRLDTMIVSVVFCSFNLP